MNDRVPLSPPVADGPPRSWPGDDTSRIPFWAYTRDDVYQRELERLFYKAHWCYVGLEAEVPMPGDFIRTVIGERSVILVRDADGQLNVVENRCAHRGMRFCRAKSGNRADFICPYHQWSYSLKGDLQGVPLKRGVRQEGQWLGGMPADFKNSEHGLTRLRVAARGGVVFASFDADVEPFEDFMGSAMLGYFDRLFNGRKLTLLGHSRQRIPGNWKLMQENIKDPYHPGAAAHLVRDLRPLARRQQVAVAHGPAGPARGDDLHPRRGPGQRRRDGRRVQLQGVDDAERRPLS